MLEVIVTRHGSKPGDLFSCDPAPSRKLWEPFLRGMGYSPVVGNTGEARNALRQLDNVKLFIFELEDGLTKNRAEAENGSRYLESIAPVCAVKKVSILAIADANDLTTPLLKDSFGRNTTYVLESPYDVQTLENGIRAVAELGVSPTAKPCIRTIGFTEDFLRHVRDYWRKANGRLTGGLPPGTDCRAGDLTIRYSEYGTLSEITDRFLDFTPQNSGGLSRLSLMLYGLRAKHDAGRTDRKRTRFELGVKH